MGCGDPGAILEPVRLAWAPAAVRFRPTAGRPRPRSARPAGRAGWLLSPSGDLSRVSDSGGPWQPFGTGSASSPRGPRGTHRDLSARGLPLVGQLEKDVVLRAVERTVPADEAQASRGP